MVNLHHIVRLTVVYLTTAFVVINFLSKILNVKVKDFDRSFSNYCMLSCIISVNFVEYMPELYNVYPLLIKNVWKSSIEKFQNVLQSAEKKCGSSSQCHRFVCSL